MRRTLYLAVMAAFVACAFLLIGQRMGLYDAALGDSIFVIAFIVVFTAAVSVTAKPLRLADVERGKIEIEREQKNQQLQGLFDHAPAGMALFDAEPPHKVLAHNKVYQQFWSEPFKSDGMIGKLIPDYAPQAEESGIFQVFREVAETREGRTIYEFSYDGMERGKTWWNWNLSPVILDGNVVAFAHMLIEVTDHVLAREEIRNLLSLEQERTEELSTQGEELAAMNEELTVTNEELTIINEDMKEANDTLRLVNDIAADFLTGASVEHSLESMLATAKRLTGASAASVAVYEHPDTLKSWVFDMGDTQCSIDLPLKIGDRMPHMAAKYAQGIVLENDTSGTVLPHGHMPLRNLLSIGVEVRGGWAHLLLANKECDFDEEDVSKVEILTRLSSIIIDRASLDESERSARAAAERQAAELEAFVTSLADGVMLLDAAGNVVFVNDVGKQMLEAPPDTDWNEFIKVGCRRYTLEGEPIPIDMHGAFRAIQGETIKNMRYRIVTPSSKEVFIGMSASPVRDANGRIVGATSVFHDESERVDLERRRRELYEREHRIADMLQQALIPPQVAYYIEGCRIAVQYEPALDEAEVGGDFYDIFHLSDGKIGILIGDVAGKGLPAAMRVAAVRYAVRSYAYLDDSPARVMSLANDALSRDRTSSSGMVTALFAVVDIVQRMVTWANCGHEPPVIRRVDGEVTDVDVEGRAVGIMRGSTYSEVSLKLRPGDVVVMMTDGITEARPGGIAFFGRDGVSRHLSQAKGRSPNIIARGLLDAAKTHAGGHLQDDAAIVVFDFVGERSALCETIVHISSGIEDLPRCREAALNAARNMGFPEADVLRIVSAVFEACVNAATHGRVRSAAAILTIRTYDDRIEAVIKDFGDGCENVGDTVMPPPTSIRGRGIPMMKLFMDDVRFEIGDGCRVTLTKYLPG